MFGLASRSSLTFEIKEKFETVKESEHTARKKKLWCESIERSIKESYPSSRLILAGSSVSGFATEGCDVDLTLIRPNRTSLYASTCDVEVLRKIRDGLRSIRSINTELIDGAVVPILKLTDRIERLEGDISVDIHNSIFNTYLQKCYANMDPRVIPLVVNVKHWAKMAGITGARDHMLSGFAVVLLVIYYLQIGCTPPVLPSLQAINPSHFSTSSSAAVTADKLTSGSLPLFVTTYRSNNNETLGNLLVGFFKFYCDFNWHQVLSVRLAGPRSVPCDRKWTRPYIRIEDPCDLKNVTRAVYKLYQFDSIRQAIRRAKGKLEYNGCRLSEIL
ncbi:poly(A) RNA polymerase GLD2-like isoform X1 [Montipora foliosa]|uniref:poly(A) RNA polymerase GLD2-like isoform X1 n=1 Tax=Montipora foliosa TaxID=591990 RepID=UPI0035F19A9F